MFDRYPEDELPSARSRHWAGVFFVMVAIAGTGYYLQTMPSGRLEFTRNCEGAGGTVFDKHHSVTPGTLICVRDNQIIFTKD